MFFFFFFFFFFQNIVLGMVVCMFIEPRDSLSCCYEHCHSCASEINIVNARFLSTVLGIRVGVNYELNWN